MRNCKVEGCENKYKAKGYCNKHYQKWLRYGNPLIIKQKHERHGKRNSAEYGSWYGMKSRCYNKNQLGYYRYGGRGIIICERWLYSFKDFLEDMGSKPFPKAQIDRIDNDGNYETGNCRWTTSAINSQNGSKTKLTTEIVENIRALYMIGNTSYGKLSNIYGVTRATVRDLIKLRTWRKNNETKICGVLASHNFRA